MALSPASAPPIHRTRQYRVTTSRPARVILPLGPARGWHTQSAKPSPRCGRETDRSGRRRWSRDSDDLPWLDQVRIRDLRIGRFQRRERDAKELPGNAAERVARLDCVDDG